MWHHIITCIYISLQKAILTCLKNEFFHSLCASPSCPGVCLDFTTHLVLYYCRVIPVHLTMCTFKMAINRTNYFPCKSLRDKMSFLHVSNLYISSGRLFVKNVRRSASYQHNTLFTSNVYIFLLKLGLKFHDV